MKMYIIFTAVIIANDIDIILKIKYKPVEVTYNNNHA